MAPARLLDNSPPDEALQVTTAHEPEKANAPYCVNEAETRPTNNASDKIDEADFLKGLTENVRDQDDLERDIANQVRPWIRMH